MLDRTETMATKRALNAPRNPRNVTDLGLLRMHAKTSGDPKLLEQYVSKVRAALNAHNGVAVAAAADLNVSRRQFMRWLAEDKALLMGVYRAPSGGAGHASMVAVELRLPPELVERVEALTTDKTSAGDVYRKALALGVEAIEKRRAGH